MEGRRRGEAAAVARWSEVTRGRQAAHSLPPILRLPLARDGRELLLGFLRNGVSLLDIGAHDRNLQRFIEAQGFTISYASLDVDRSREHDYYELSSVDRSFDIVVAFDVVEHMTVGEAMECFRRVQRDLLKPGGVFLVGTPNVSHPVVFWRDCTHITPFRYDELYGLLAAAGFSRIEIIRCGRFSLRDRVTALCFRPLLKLLRLDFAPGITAIARKG